MMSFSKPRKIAPAGPVQYVYARGSQRAQTDIPFQADVAQQCFSEQLRHLQERLVWTEHQNGMARAQLHIMIEEKNKALEKVRLLEEELSVLQTSIDQGE